MSQNQSMFERRLQKTGFTLVLEVDDEQAVTREDLFIECRMILRELPIRAVKFQYEGVTYTYCRDNRVIVTAVQSFDAGVQSLVDKGVLLKNES